MNPTSNSMPGEIIENLNHPFAYFKPSEGALPVIQTTRDAYQQLYTFLISLPPCRERAVALTELETSAMWAIKGIVINDAGTTRPEVA